MQLQNAKPSTELSKIPKLAVYFLSFCLSVSVGAIVGIAQTHLPNNGYLPILAFALGLILLPTSQDLTSRIAINGVLMLGLLPILWWGTASFNISRVFHTSSIASFLIISITVFFVSKQILSRSRWLPHSKPSDLLLAAAALFMVWLYLPFINGASSSSALLQSMGGDIVAHFTMVIKTIETGVSGSGWGIAPDETPFVYVNYPQHFHTTAAYFGQSFSRTSEEIIESNSSAFMAGLAITIIFSVLILASLSLNILREKKGFFLPGLLIIGSVAAISAGFGASNIQSGFPNFVLAAVGVLYSFFLAIQAKPVKSIEVIASASAVVLVINCWFLLSPIALGLLVISLWRYQLNKSYVLIEKRSTWATSILLVFLGYAWSIHLISAASSGIGGPINVLSVPGGTPSMPLRQVIGISFLVLSIGIFLLTQKTKFVHSDTRVPAFGFIGLVSFSLCLLFGLVAFQRLQGASTSYYQQKLANGIYLVMTVALVAAIVIVCDLYWEKFQVSNRQTRWAIYLTCWLGTFLALSSVPGFITGLEMRVGVATEASRSSEASERLISASGLLGELPCEVPVYLALQGGDPPADISNQWGHAMSGTWTESSGPVNYYLWSQSLSWDFENKSGIINDFLAEFPKTCVIVSPEVFESYQTGNTASNFARVLTW